MGKERIKENFYRVRAKIGKLDLLVKRIKEEIVDPCRKMMEESFSEGLSRFSEVEKATDKLQKIVESLVDQIVSLESNRLRDRKLVSLMSQLEVSIQSAVSSFENLRKSWISNHSLLKEMLNLDKKPIGEIRELVEPLTIKSDEMHQLLEETLSKWRLSMEFRPTWERLLVQIDQLQNELGSTLKKCLPESKKIDELIQPITSAVAHLEKNYEFPFPAKDKNLVNDNQTIVDHLPARAMAVMRQLQEISTRSVLFRKLQPVVASSISQLTQLAQVLKEAIETYQFEPKQLEDIWQPLTLSLKEVRLNPEEMSSVGQNLKVWESLFEEIQDLWVSCVNNLNQAIGKT